MSQAGAVQLPFIDSSATNINTNSIKWIKNNFSGITTTKNRKNVDEIITQLVNNQSFNSYVKETNKIILKDTSKYEDISKKYR
jgi:hypothetical protein